MKTLPLCDPLISNYPQHAFYLSIISDNKDCQPWIYSNYTNLFLSDWKNDEIFLDFYVQTPEHHFNPWFKDSQRLHRDLILGSIPNLVSFIRSQIDSGNYVWTHVDEYFIPDTPSYHTRRFAHAVLIYGYDDSTREFQLAGFFKYRSYSRTTVPYDDLKTAFEHCDIYDDYLNYTHLLKINPEYHNNKIYEFDLSYFAECMENYYTSINETENYKSFYTPKLYSDRTFGLDIYNKLTMYFELMLSKQRTIDTRLLYTLREHKKFMNLKIKYIEQEGHYRFPAVFKDNYTRVEKETTIMLNQFLKYGITQCEDNIIKLIGRLGFLYQLENETLELLLSDFSKQGITGVRLR
ncbi:BtrH N-terminal domain-containing protein [Paenibacillus sp. BJ-4]|uniref:BtrH N-terminal domain-containing protein n=1 Tax=Paenibacillus sp. BJ-4 TaxID=2878097 RepID=UPI001CF069F1|nr:BtrH N-terminal domain-containing protein [Paenibacillus sp. BJ-4]